MIGNIDEADKGREGGQKAPAAKAAVETAAAALKHSVTQSCDHQAQHNRRAISNHFTIMA
jgi:hypothetical protein